MIALLLLSSGCHLAVIVLCIAVPWVGLQYTIVASPGHTTH